MDKTKTIELAEEKSKVILSFKANWYIDGFSAEFDGFKLKMTKGSGEERRGA